MTGIRALFKELDESYKKKVRLGDDKQIQIEWKGVVALSNEEGKVKHFVPSLSQNLQV